ncbi:sugar phosphate nucleotidyltransferase [Halobacillus kuroshimensis]|uniref:sugar phosphate nucleotidyltransferase n=1 Tax=Halobacillus kuroshimensis TaxID=302481 RepID=UPI00040B99FD|nr:sugar phosphate nucleotidyltransferase [Halobacillus kuroshimensis]
MKGVILAGGTGSRLYPKTRNTNKHLLPVGGVPMIHHGIGKLKEAGIDEILIVTGKAHIDLMIEELGFGGALGVRVSYEIQEEAGGVAEALGLAGGFSGGEPVAVLLGDNIFSDSLEAHVRPFLESEAQAMVFLKRVKDPERFGIATFADGRICAIEEKPSKPVSDYAVTGIYLYKPQVFSIINRLKPSERKELEITDVNRAFLHTGLLDFRILTGHWIDAGTHASLAEADRLFTPSVSAEVRHS